MTPNQAFVIALVSALLAGLPGVLSVVMSKRLHAEIKPPSNGRTLGAIVEGQAVKQSMVAQDYVERVKAHSAGEPPPPPPVIPFSLTPTVDDPGLMDRVNEGIKNAQSS